MTIKIGFNQKILILFLVISSMLLGFTEFEDNDNRYMMRESISDFTFIARSKDFDRLLNLKFNGDDSFSIYYGDTNMESYYRYLGFEEYYSQTYNLSVHDGRWQFCSLPNTMFWGYNYSFIYSNIMTNKRIKPEVKEIFDKNYREIVRRFLKAKKLEKSRGITEEGF